MTNKIIENENMLKISLIGAGNMAWQLARSFSELSVTIEEVYSRSMHNAHQLSQEFPNPTPTDQLDFSHSAARIFFLCVADQAMEHVLAQLQLPQHAILVHTSGSQSMQVLQSHFQHVGVFYPFQTVSKGKPIDFSQVPICLEAANDHILAQLKVLGKQLSNKLYVINSDSRKRLHLAAIFACNFVNHLFAISQDLLAQAGMEIEMVEHLVHETVTKAFAISPKKAQTGPAIRGDQNIIAEHLALLQGNETSSEIYQLLTKSIIEMHNVKVD